MLLPIENRDKVRNIVMKQMEQFRELYRRLAVGLPGVHWGVTSASLMGGSEMDGVMLEQDMDPKVRVMHLRKLPVGLAGPVDGWFAIRTAELGLPSKEADEEAYWKAIAGDGRLNSVIKNGRLFRYHSIMFSS
jgi:translocator assembly and maintenance protein 41